MSRDIISNHFYEAKEALNSFISNPDNINKIRQAGELLVKAIKNGNKIISCGNGGSMCDAMHFAEELTGRYREDRNAIPAIAISDPSYLTCTGNDYGFDKVFSRFIEAMGNNGDVLLAISTSGNSGNIIEAAKVAGEKKMMIIALTGKDGGKLANLSDVEIRAPYSKYADRAQEIHIKVIHSLIDYVEQNLQ